MALTVTCFSAPTLHAAESEGVAFADRYEWQGTQLRLNGVGLLRYRIVIKGYVAALYLGEQVVRGDVRGDRPQRRRGDATAPEGAHAAVQCSLR
jgi:hypothetical protein